MCSCAEVPILLLTSNLLYWRYVGSIGVLSIYIHQLYENDKQHSHLVPSMSLLRSVKPVRRVCVKGQDSIPIAANASIHPTAAPKHKKSIPSRSRGAGRGKRGESEKRKKSRRKPGRQGEAFDKLGRSGVVQDAESTTVRGCAPNPSKARVSFRGDKGALCLCPDDSDSTAAVSLQQPCNVAPEIHPCWWLCLSKKSVWVRFERGL